MFRLFTTIHKTEISAQPEFLKLVSAEFEHLGARLSQLTSPYTVHVQLNVFELTTTVEGHDSAHVSAQGMCLSTLIIQTFHIFLGGGTK